MLRASEAKKIADTDITKELKAIEKEIRNAAALGKYQTSYRLPFAASAEVKEKILETLRSNGYKVSGKEFHDPASGWSIEEVTISWEGEA